MNHENRGRLTVDPAGKWKLYTQTLPENSTPLGTITRDFGDSGALVQLPNGKYAQVNEGVLRGLDGRKVAAAMGTAGPPQTLQGGKRINAYLDSETIDIAKKLGDGNLSEGIRAALRSRAQSLETPEYHDLLERQKETQLISLR